MFLSLASNTRSTDDLVDYNFNVLELYARFGQNSILDSQCLDIISTNNVIHSDSVRGRVSRSPCWHESIQKSPLAPGVFDPWQPQIFRANKKAPLTTKAIIIEQVHKTAGITTFLAEVFLTEDSIWGSVKESEDLDTVIGTLLEGRVRYQQPKIARRIDDHALENFKGS